MKLAGARIANLHAGLLHCFQVTSLSLHMCKQQTIRAADALHENLYSRWKNGEKWRKGDTIQLWKLQKNSTETYSADPQHHGYFITLKHVYMSHVDITAALFLARNRSRTFGKSLQDLCRIYIYFNPGSMEKRACGHF